MITAVPRNSRVHAAVALLAAGVALGYVGTSVIPGQLDKDWVHLWAAGRALVTGGLDALYSPTAHHQILCDTYPDGVPEDMWPPRNQRLGVFFYPPHAAMYYAALGWLSRPLAGTINALITTGLAVLCALAVARLAGVRWSVALLALLFYPPFFYNYALGQNAMLTATAVIGAWWLSNRRRELLAGVLLGLLVCKPNWLMAVGWIPLVHGRWRMLAGIALSASVYTAAIVACGGADAVRHYVDLVPQVMSLPQESGYTLQLKVSALGLFRKWFGAGELATLCGYGSAAVVAGVTWWTTRGRWAVDPARVWGCCILASLWINPHLNNYDLVLAATVLPVLWRSRYLSAVAAAVLTGAVYVACPLDNNWSLWATLPVPCFALVGAWMVMIVDARRAACGPEPAHSDCSVHEQAACLGMVQPGASQ